MKPERSESESVAAEAKVGGRVAGSPDALAKEVLGGQFDRPGISMRSMVND